MFLLKQSTLSAVIFLLVPLGLLLFCVYYILMLYRSACVVSSNVVSDECDVLDKAALRIQQKCDKSALRVQQIDVAKEIKYPEEFRSRYAMFVNCNTSINNREYHVRRRFDREPSRIPVKKLEKLSRKNKKIKKLVCRRILKSIPVSSKCIATSNADLEQGAIMTLSSFYKT